MIKSDANVIIRRNDIAYLRLMCIPIVLTVLVMILVLILSNIVPTPAAPSGMAIATAGGFLCLVIFILIDRRPLITIRENVLIYHAPLSSLVKPVKIKTKDLIETKYDQTQDIPCVIRLYAYYKYQLKATDREVFGRTIRLILNNGRIIRIPYLRIFPEDREIFENTLNAIVAENRARI